MSVNMNEMPKLGFGLMRLPETDGKIDMDEVCRMVDMYMEAGLNYFDTAYVYHGGISEIAAKEAIVKRYPRGSFRLATKLPAWEMKEESDRDRIFNEQLDRAGVDYFDFYLLHSVENGNIDTYEKFDCFNWGLQKKAEGKIRHFGFSFHGSPDLLESVLDRHPEVEFVQIQLNYADWNNPVVRSGQLYNILLKRNIPMIIMEPVKGGSLASLKPEFEAIYKALRPESSAASWAFRFVASLPGVMTILSGMTHEDQMRDNIATFTHFEPLNDEERKAIEDVTAAMLNIPLIGCTACRYCVDGCPKNIPIPKYFSVYNAEMQEYKGKPFTPQGEYYDRLTQVYGKPGDCIGCGKCERICPQHLPIRNNLKLVASQFE